MSFPLRAWATPLIVGSFLVMGATGTLMFFHLNTGLSKGVHEWAGWVMLLGAGAHIVLNWRAFTTYFRRPLANAIMGAGALLLAVSVIPFGSESSGGPDAAIRQVMGKLVDAPVSELAVLADSTPDAVIAKLVAAGYADASATATPKDLAGADMGAAITAIGTVFAD